LLCQAVMEMVEELD